MMKTRLALLLATCVTTAAGCSDTTPTDTGTSPATGATAGNPGGTSTGSSTGGSTGSSTGTTGSSGSGSTGVSGSGTTGSTSNTGDGYDAAVSEPTPGDCQDDETTLGNDCPGLVTCSADVDACSLDTQNCCVKDYNPDAASCNEGDACDGLAKAACDGPEDCPDTQQCCISVSAGLGGAEIKHRCVADATQCTGGLIVNRILCHSDDDCANGESCEPIGNLPWWGICK